MQVEKLASKLNFVLTLIGERNIVAKSVRVEHGLDTDGGVPSAIKQLVFVQGF